MDIATRVFLKKKFKDYYWKHEVPPPVEIYRREFGWGTVEEKIKQRHKVFNNERELQNFLRREAPFYISYSIAYYEFPAMQPMSAKNWLGADLVFDLDQEMEYVNYKNLEEVKTQALQLMDFLTHDFGFSRKEIKVNFSGHKGYHIHVCNDEVKQLGSEERREIVEYVTGNLRFQNFLKVEGGDKIKGPRKGDSGWGGRIYQELKKLLSSTDVKQLYSIPGIGVKKAESILTNRERLLSALEKGEYHRMPEIISFKVVRRKVKDPRADKNVPMFYITNVHSPLIEKLIRSKAITIKSADHMVTIDTSRLIRLPETLHGGSGLLAKSTSNLEDFDPLTHALAFKKGEIRVRVTEKIPEFEMNQQSFGGFEKYKVVELPEYAGIYLLLRGKGDVLT